jgi:hypothetical protein
MSLLIYLLVLVLIFGLIVYAVRMLPLPAPWNQVALVVVALIFILLLLNAFMPLLPGWRVL